MEHPAVRHRIAPVPEAPRATLRPDAARPPVRRRLQTISGRPDRIASTITDVHVLFDAVTDDLDLRPVDLTAAIEREVENLREVHPSVEVDVDVATDLTVLADEMLCRVHANVLSNAVEHNDGADPRVSVFAERLPEAIVVRVADNGPGIPPERRETIFERGQGGHGLGLHLVRSLVTRYGGTIEVTGTGPDGTTISITLPLAEPGTADGESRSDTPSPDVEAGIPA